MKYLSPNSKEWKLFKKSEDAYEKNDDESIKNNLENLSNFLLSSLQMQNLIVLAGSGTSLGNVKGPSMNDLWTAIAHENNSSRVSEKMKKIADLVNYNISKNNNIEEWCDPRKVDG